MAERPGHRGTRAIQQMVEHAPSTGGLALWVHHQDLSDDAGSGLIVSTDGHTLFYGHGFQVLPLQEQVGWVAHEVLHIALRHPQRFLALQQLLGDVDLQLFNLCADALVNSALSHLAWLKLPPFSVYLDVLLEKTLGIKQTVETSLLEWDVERLYRAIDDRRPAGGKAGGKEGKAKGGGAGEGTRKTDNAGAQGRARHDGPRAEQVRALGHASRADLRPGVGARGAPEAEADASREWGERLTRGHAGDGAHSMLRTLLHDLPKSRIPWEQVLRTLLTRALSPSPSVSWSRPSRSYLANQGRSGTLRMPWEPGFSSTRAVPRLAVIVDVSGSIGGALLEHFTQEVEAIARRLEAGLVLIVGDDQVRRVETFAPGEVKLGTLETQGGGGTDFAPLLEEAGRHAPDIAVVLTDLDGPAGPRPRFPILWAVPETHALAVPPFGRKLTLGLV